MNHSELPLAGLDVAALLASLPNPVVVIEFARTSPMLDNLVSQGNVQTSTPSTLHFNQAASELLGEVNQGQPWPEYFPLAIREDLRELVDQARAGHTHTLHFQNAEDLTVTVSPLAVGVLLHFSSNSNLGRHFARMLDTIEVGSTLSTLTGELLHMNDVAAQMLGVNSPSEALGHNFHDSSWYPTRTDGSLMPLSELPTLQVANSGKPVRNFRFGIHYFSQKVLHSRWVRATGLPQRDLFGNLQSVLTVMYDETEMHRFDEQITLDKARYRSLLQSATKLIWKAAADGTFEQRQPDWEKFTGQPTNQYLGSSTGWLEKVHPDDREHTRKSWQGCLLKQEPCHLLHRIQRFDGSYVLMQSRSVPIRDASGRVQEWVGTCIDLSVAEVAEEAFSTLNRELELRIQERSTELSKASRFNRLLLNSAGEGIFGLDTEGVCTFINPAAARILGYNTDDLLGKQICNLLHSVYRDGSLRKLEKSLIYQTLHDGQRRRVPSDVFWHADGYTLPVSFTVNPILSDNGLVTGVVVTFQDISERLYNQKALEDAIIELQRSNAELEQFAYVASHDLQEPLRTIGSYAELLSRRYQGQLDSRADQYLLFIDEAVLRMQSLMRDLLTFAKVGRSNLIQEEVSVHDLMSQVKNNVMATLLESEGKLIWNTQERITAHPWLLIQLLTNLVSNAIKFRKPDVPPEIEVVCQKLNDKVIILVKDNGIGIAPEYHERVFAIFQRLHRRDTYEGNGMGLAICRKIAERHGGSLSVLSLPPEGSTFELILPQNKNLG